MNKNSGYKVNKHINVREVLEETFRIMLHKPVILLPMLILWVFDRISGSLLLPFFQIPDKISSFEDLVPYLPSILKYFIIYFCVIFIIYAFIEGIYPPLIKNMLENKNINMLTATRFVFGRALTLIAAGILIGIIVFAGLLFFIIPGLIFAVWYFYAVPYIMLENRGILDAMRASKAFSSDNKTVTFNLFSAPFLLIFIGGFIADVFFIAIPDVRLIINIILNTVVYTWFSVIPPYVYLKYNKMKEDNIDFNNLRNRSARDN